MSFTRACKHCNAAFPIDDQDCAFYKQVSFNFGGAVAEIPAPTLCPPCRLQRRLSFRNQIYVARVKASGAEGAIFSQFLVQPPFPVISNKEWWDGSLWSAESYGREYDFSKPFFQQLKELSDAVPRPAINAMQSENSDYCNNAGALKNCYFVFDAGDIEDSFYCDAATSCKDSIDCSLIYNCELCYDCTSCTRCYDLQSSEDCTDCSESYFLRGCRSCKHCFGCVNLRQQEYMIFNQKVAREEYLSYVAALVLASYSERARIAQQVKDFWHRSPRPHIAGSRIENCSGNHLHSCKDVRDSYFVSKSESLRYCMVIGANAKNCYDYYCWGENAELLYECSVTGGDVFHCAFCDNCWYGAAELLYCTLCHGSTNCFGCIGLHKRNYYILNKRYSADQYNALLPRIIEHMRQTGEWGEYPPMQLSPYPYNMTLAQRYFPLSKGEATSKRLLWLEEDKKVAPDAIPAAALPDALPPTDNALTVTSLSSGQAFRITSQEIKKYRKFKVPLPRETYAERMNARAKLLGGIRLAPRPCEKTGQIVQTVYQDLLNDRVMEKDVFEEEFA